MEEKNGKVILTEDEYLNLEIRLEELEKKVQRRGKLNRKRKIIVLIGLIVIILVGLYPPWNINLGIRGSESCGYGFIWSPPESRYGTGACTLDAYRLLVQWIGVCIDAGGLAWLFKDNGS